MAHLPPLFFENEVCPFGLFSKQFTVGVLNAFKCVLWTALSASRCPTSGVQSLTCVSQLWTAQLWAAVSEKHKLCGVYGDVFFSMAYPLAHLISFELCSFFLWRGRTTCSHGLLLLV